MAKKEMEEQVNDPKAAKLQALKAAMAKIAGRES